jgi:zinc and cadmium transporter
MSAILLYSALVFIVALSAGAPALSHDRESGRQGPFLAFAAGFILATALLFLVPEAVEKGKAAWVLAGFLFVFLGEHWVMMHGCQGEDCEVHRMGLAAYVGLSLHTLASGLSIGAAVRQDAALGLMTFLAVVLHKGPEAFSLAALLHHSGRPRATSLAMLAGYAGIVPAAAIGSYLFLSERPETLIAVVIGFSAGTFLEVGAADLLPQVHRHGPGRGLRFLGFLGGTALAVLAETIARHGGH